MQLAQEPTDPVATESQSATAVEPAAPMEMQVKTFVGEVGDTEKGEAAGGWSTEDIYDWPVNNKKERYDPCPVDCAPGPFQRRIGIFYPNQHCTVLMI